MTRTTLYVHGRGGGDEVGAPSGHTLWLAVTHDNNSGSFTLNAVAFVSIKVLTLVEFKVFLLLTTTKNIETRMTGVFFIYLSV